MKHSHCVISPCFLHGATAFPILPHCRAQQPVEGKRLAEIHPTESKLDSTPKQSAFSILPHHHAQQPVEGIDLAEICGTESKQNTSRCQT